MIDTSILSEILRESFGLGVVTVLSTYILAHVVHLSLFFIERAV